MSKTKDIEVILKYAIGISNKNDFEGIESFKNFKNKRGSGYYLLHKIKSLKEGDFYFDNIYDLIIMSKEDVLNRRYTIKIKKLINFIQIIKI